MATINYTKTELGNNRVLVEWLGMSNGDVGQEFDAAGLEIESCQATTGGQMRQSNDSASSSPSFNDGQTFSISAFTKPLNSRWYSPQAASSGNVRALFREV